MQQKQSAAQDDATLRDKWRDEAKEEEKEKDVWMLRSGNIVASRRHFALLCCNRKPNLKYSMVFILRIPYGSPDVLATPTQPAAKICTHSFANSARE